MAKRRRPPLPLHPRDKWDIRTPPDFDLPPNIKPTRPRPGGSATSPFVHHGYGGYRGGPRVRTCPEPDDGGCSKPFKPPLDWSWRHCPRCKAPLGYPSNRAVKWQLMQVRYFGQEIPGAIAHRFARVLAAGYAATVLMPFLKRYERSYGIIWSVFNPVAFQLALVALAGTWRVWMASCGQDGAACREAARASPGRPPCPEHRSMMALAAARRGKGTAFTYASPWKLVGKKLIPRQRFPVQKGHKPSLGQADPLCEAVAAATLQPALPRGQPSMLTARNQLRRFLGRPPLAASSEAVSIPGPYTVKVGSAGIKIKLREDRKPVRVFVKATVNPRSGIRGSLGKDHVYNPHCTCFYCSGVTPPVLSVKFRPR